MGRNEDFDNALWSHPRFEELSPLAALFYIWSWTNPYCGMGGIYEVGRRTMTQSKITEKELDAVLTELDRGGWLYYRHGVLWVCARVRRLRSKTSQIATAVARDVVAVSAGHPLRVAWLQKYGSDAWLRNALDDVGVDPLEQRDSVRFTDTSPEVPLSGSGQVGVKKTSQSNDVDARGQIISELFAYWQEQCGHPHAMLSPERRRKIAGRLREGFTPQQCREAIDGAAVGAFVGDNGKRHDGIALIFRDAEKLESFIGRRARGVAVRDQRGPHPHSPSDLIRAARTKGEVIDAQLA